MPRPLPTQLSGAVFLAERHVALLADEPRVGKTGAAIIGADYIFAQTILVVTTASGRAVWKRGLAEWSAFPRTVQVALNGTKLDPRSDVVIVGWPSVGDPTLRAQLLQRKWDLVILDESHYAKSVDTKRTQAVYGQFLEADRLIKGALADKARTVWCLTGTPIPNAPNDLYPMMRALCPKRLLADPARGWTDVMRYEDFLKRYCVVKPKKISNFRWIQVVIGGRNEKELRDRLGDFMLLRTQADVGIQPPIYELLPLIVGPRALREAEKDVDRQRVLAAAKAGETKTLDDSLGALLRVTGEIKAREVVEAVKEEFDCGLRKIVLMAWHKETIRILTEGLSTYGVVGIDGSSSPTKRADAEERFRDDPKIRVFVGQIVAAGEAIDLSAASDLIFVESSWEPKNMKQASLRVTNHTQTRQVRVRVAVLEGSIDEALQTILLRKWGVIREVLA